MFRFARSVRRALRLLMATTVSACFPIPVDIPTRPGEFDARTLEGEWFVAATNFPMWLAGDRCDPRFLYSNLRQKDGLVVMDDTVSYLRQEKTERQTIEGFDTQDPSQPAHFTWRGAGILMLFTSEWYVAHHNEASRYAIIYFTETLATPAGVDVITREPQPSAELIAEANDFIQKDAFLRAQAQGLVWLRSASKEPTQGQGCGKR